MTEKCKKIIEEHKNSIEKGYFLPVFLAALLKGGIELFDELRAHFEDAGIELTNEYFKNRKNKILKLTGYGANLSHSL